MHRILAALIFVLWTTGYVRCVAEQSSMLPNHELACCHDGSSPEHDKPPSEDIPCCVCDGISFGILLGAQPFQFACLILAMTAALLVAAWGWVRWVLCLSVPLGRSFSNQETPPVVQRLWEYLVHTALPVRGPSLNLA